ncbi:MAG: enoyl-CoA hydratase-related protein [Sulfuricaulis sp.]|nr:enoyl-CoA hydratase-related protein [Sulfuricaulis sp.]
MTQFIVVEKESHATIITLNRPEVFNALHPPAHMELESAFDEFAADPDQWIAIITGAGERAFCAGNDLKYTAAGNKLEAGPRGFAGLTARFDLTKPVIAAVNGLAMGGGFEIALACDLVIASANAEFALPEPRVGLVALTGGVHRLPKQIPLKQAMGMMLTGHRVSAQRGLEMGFVTEIAPVGQALSAAKRWAAEISECSPMAVRATKEAIYHGLDVSVAEAWADQLDQVAMKALFSSWDIQEGPRAFAEKRKPRWLSNRNGLHHHQ